MRAGSTDGRVVSPDGPGQSADLRLHGAVEMGRQQVNELLGWRSNGAACAGNGLGAVCSTLDRRSRVAGRSLQQHVMGAKVA